MVLKARSRSSLLHRTAAHGGRLDRSAPMPWIAETWIGKSLMPPKKALCCTCFSRNWNPERCVAALQPQAKARVGASVFTVVGGYCMCVGMSLCNYRVHNTRNNQEGARTQPNQRRWHADGS